MPRYHYHGHLWGDSLEPFQHLYPIHSGHFDVKKYNVDAPLLELLNSCSPIFGKLHIEAFQAQYIF